jgi:hypothetical protein
MNKQEVKTVEASQVIAMPPQLSPRMQEYLATQQQGERSFGGGGIKYLSTAGATFKFEGQAIPNNALAVIVLDSIAVNVLYREKYNEDAPVPPNCFAFGRSDKDMKPHEEAIEKVAPNCKACHLSKFGSAKEIKWKKSERGCGCNMRRRLALLSIGEVLKDGKVKLNADDIDTSEICYLNVPVTSVYNFKSYKDKMERIKHDGINAPLCFIATRIGIVNDDKTMWKMTFEQIKTAVDMYGAEHPVSLLSDPVIMSKIEARQEEAMAMIETPFSVPSSDDADDTTMDKPVEKATRKEKF